MVHAGQAARGGKGVGHGAVWRLLPVQPNHVRDLRVTPSGPHLKSHWDFLSPRMPEAKWVRTCNPYSGWKLWRDRTPPKPLVPETTADVRKRERAWLRSAKPHGYSWRVEKLTPAQRIALGCLPKPAAQTTVRRVREAA